MNKSIQKSSLVFFPLQNVVKEIMSFPMVQKPLLQLVSLAQQPLDLRLHGVHLGDEGSIVMGLAIQVHLKSTLALLDLQVPGLQQLKVFM